MSFPLCFFYPAFYGHPLWAEMKLILRAATRNETYHYIQIFQVLNSQYIFFILLPLVSQWTLNS